MKNYTIIMLVIGLSYMAGSCFAENDTIVSHSSQQVPASDLGTPLGSGIFEFRSNVEGARVLLDEMEMGVITKGILQVAVPVYERPVKRQLRIESPGYSSYNETLLQSPEVDDIMIVRGKLQVLPLTLTGTLSLAISPPGGQVSIDGVVMGVVDQSGILVLRTVKSGNRLVKVTLPGYQDYEKQIYLESNMNTELRITLVPLTTGTLQISSNPPGAQVSLNGTRYGITPVTAPNLEQGTYTIEILLPGYQPYQSSVVLSPGQNIPVSAALHPVPTVSTPTPTPEPTIPEPTPIPTQAGLPSGMVVIGLFVVLCLNLKKN
jgi:hypothetical protein